MENVDIKLMNEAIDWADKCSPSKESIPKVGAVIAIGDTVIGRGRRGTGIEGDDDHAEHVALKGVKDRTQLPKATLYTTLEPCTPEVRTRGLECCTELILQNEIRKVFVGILDPNQGVTGKGLWKLQHRGVEVALFPHDLAMKIRSQNAAFIRSQETLGATIISPKNGDSLKIYETGKDCKQTIRVKCINEPGTNNYLLIFHGGLCWPQPGLFQPAGERIWEIDAYFGSTGDHMLYLVTANNLGRTLVDYYQKVVESNRELRKKLRVKEFHGAIELLSSDYTGIQMNGLPKGFQREASLALTIAQKP